MSNVLTRLEDSSVATLVNVKVNEKATLTLANLLDKEIQIKSSKHDSFLNMNKFALEIEQVDRKFHRMKLVHKNTNRSYRLTETSYRQLMVKLSDKKALSEIFLTTEYDLVISSYNAYLRKTFKRLVTSIEEVNASFYSLSKILDKGLLSIVCTRLMSTHTEAYQFRFIQSKGVGFIRAILDKKYENFDNMDLMELLTQRFDNEWTVKRLYQDSFSDKITLQVTKKFNNEKNNTVGTPMEYGFLFTNSETGLASVTGQVGVYVLKCTNGMVGLEASDSFSLIHNRSSKDDFINALDKLFEQGLMTWNKIALAYEKSKEIEVKDAKELIKTICEDYSLGQKVSQDIYRLYQRDLQKDNISNLYKIVDSFTEVAHRNYNINQENFHKLTNVGSELLLNTEKFLSSN